MLVVGFIMVWPLESSRTGGGEGEAGAEEDWEGLEPEGLLLDEEEDLVLVLGGGPFWAAISACRKKRGSPRVVKSVRGSGLPGRSFDTCGRVM